LLENEGATRFSFANLLYHQRPLMIVDEAHNAISGLTRDVRARIRSAAIMAFTAAPNNRNNILHSVTARAPWDEEVIKRPIRVQPLCGILDQLAQEIRVVARDGTLKDRGGRHPGHVSQDG